VDVLAASYVSSKVPHHHRQIIVSTKLTQGGCYLCKYLELKNKNSKKTSKPITSRGVATYITTNYIIIYSSRLLRNIKKTCQTAALLIATPTTKVLIYKLSLCSLVS